MKKETRKVKFEGLETTTGEDVRMILEVCDYVPSSKDEEAEGTEEYIEVKEVSFSLCNKTDEAYVLKEVNLPSTIEEKKVKYARNYGRSIFNIVSGRLSIQKLTFNGVEELPNAAFSNLDIDTVIWPESCSTIPTECFIRATVRHIVFEKPLELKKIENRAFFLTRMDEFEWPEGCDIIPVACFFASSIKKIHGGENIRGIESCAFEHSDLEEIPEFKNLDYVESGAFKETALKNISLNTAVVNSGCFMGCPNLETVHITSRAPLTLGRFIFYDSPNIKSVTINAGNIEISGRAFECPDDVPFLGKVNICSAEKLVIHTSKEKIENFLNPSFDCEITYIETDDDDL